MASSEEKSIAVLISGGGTTLRNLITKVDDGMLDAQIGVVISSTQNAGGLQFSAEAEIPNRCVERSEFAVMQSLVMPFSLFAENSTLTTL